MAFKQKNKNIVNININTNKKIPILILDKRWHTLFPEDNKNKTIKDYEKILGNLLKEQGKLNMELKEYSKLKKKMMTDILSNMSDALESNNQEASKLLEKNKQYIYDINDKLTKHEQRLDSIPYEIREVNEKLLKESLTICYDKMQANSDYIAELSVYIEETKKIIKQKAQEKQECEDENNNIYTYMHDLLGHEDY